MTCLNPHAHHISVTSSQTWDWIACSPRPCQLAREARKRYRWLRWHATHGATLGQNVSLTCRHFGISRPAFYRWQHRFERSGLAGLEDRSHRPQHCRRPSWTSAQVQAVLLLREQYPAWGKPQPTQSPSPQHVLA
jgi:hypothetical protein